MKYTLRSIICACGLLAVFGIQTTAQPAYRTYIDPDENHDVRMEWWREARFGLFIHWGLYSIPAGVWKGETARKDYAEWAQHNFKIPNEEYEQLTKEFNPTEFDAEFWADLAKQAGMGYFVLTTKHHDGFALFDSEVSEYDVMDATPFKRDIFRELADAFRERGMKACAYYSQDLDWNENQGGSIVKAYNTWDFPRDKPDQELFDKYFQNKSLPQVKELSTKYGDIGLFWFDFPRMMNRERGEELHALVRKYQPNAIINGRLCNPQGYLADYLVPGDNGFFTSPQPVDWECCATMDESWGYKIHAHANRTGTEIIQQLAGTVAAGGNLLLNIGPKPDGTIPQRQIDILKEIGSWMKINSESIHGAKANPFGEYFPWGVCTVKNSTLYLHVKTWEEGLVLPINRLGNTVKKVEVLGDAGRKLDWQQDGESLKIKLAGKAVFDCATVIKVTCEGDSIQAGKPKIVAKNGTLDLPSSYAKSYGQRMSRLLHKPVDGDVLVNMSEGHRTEVLVWNLEAAEPGSYEVKALFKNSQSGGSRPRTIQVRALNGGETSGEVQGNKVQGDQASLGKLELSGTEPNQVILNVKGNVGAPLYLSGLQLIKQ